MDQEDKQKLAEVVEIVTSIAETVNFIKDNAAMQSDMDASFDAVDKRFENLHQEMNERFDGVAMDIRAIRADIADIKTRLTALEKRTIEDANAAAKEILELKERLEKVERQVTQLQQAHQSA